MEPHEVDAARRFESRRLKHQRSTLQCRQRWICLFLLGIALYVAQRATFTSVDASTKPEDIRSDALRKLVSTKQLEVLQHRGTSANFGRKYAAAMSDTRARKFRSTSPNAFRPGLVDPPPPPLLFRIESQWYDWNAQKVRTRKDFSKHVAKALIDAGLQPAGEAGYDVLWGLHWSNVFTGSGWRNPIGRRHLPRVQPILMAQRGDLYGGDLRAAWGALRADQTINMLPGVVELLCTKRAFAQMRAEAVVRFGSTTVASFLPPSFELPANREEFNRAVESEGAPSTWVFKPNNAAEGSGIKLFVAGSSEEQLPLRLLRGSGVVQRHVSDLLLFHGRKFDLRTWAVVTSVLPLRAAIVHDAHIKIATTRRYVPPLRADGHASNTIGDDCMHLTNGALQRRCRERASSEQRENSGSVDLAPVDLPHSLWAAAFALGLDAKGDDAVQLDDLWRRIEDAMVNTLLLPLQRLREYSRVTTARSFQLLAFDLIISRDLSVYVLEVNADGYTGGGLQHVPHGRDCLPDLFRLVLPKKPSGREPSIVDTALKVAAAEGIPGGMQSVDAMTLEVAHEEAVLKSSRCWKRLLPRRSNNGAVERVTLGHPLDRLAHEQIFPAV